MVRPMDWKLVMKVTWPLVAMVLVGAAALLGVLFLIPNQPELRTALVTSVIAIVGGVVTTQGAATRSRVETVQQQTNGTVEKLLARMQHLEETNLRLARQLPPAVPTDAELGRTADPVVGPGPDGRAPAGG